MNRIPGAKFPFFLNRLLANLHVKDGQPFSESEEVSPKQPMRHECYMMMRCRLEKNP